MSAFAQAAAGGDDSVSGAGDALSVLSQRVWSLVQTTTSIVALTASVGGADDSAALRQRLAAEDKAGIALQEEVEAGLVRVRVSLMNTGVGVHTNQRALKRLEAQFDDTRDKFVAAVNAGRVKRRQHVLAGAGVGAGAAGGGDVGGSRRPPRAGAPGGEGIVIEMRNFGDADLAMAQERQEEALSIARESAALNRVVRDLHGLVHEQEEDVVAVEAQVDKALDSVASGVAQLEVAAKYQTAYRWKWACVIFGVVAVITVLLVLHFAVTPRVI